MIVAIARASLAAVVLILTAGAALSEPAALPHPLVVNAGGRDGIDLDGPWHYSIDPYRDGLGGFHGGAAGRGHRRYDDTDVEAAMQADPEALYEYDMKRSPEGEV